MIQACFLYYNLSIISEYLALSSGFAAPVFMRLHQVKPPGSATDFPYVTRAPGPFPLWRLWRVEVSHRWPDADLRL
jgi:hypothetical protein